MSNKEPRKREVERIEEALRSLMNVISFKIDDKPLKLADKKMDLFKEHVEETGDVFEEMGFLSESAFDGIAKDAEKTGRKLEGFAKDASNAGEEVADSFDGVSSSLSNIGEVGSQAFGALKSGFAGVLALGVTGYFFGAAANIQTLEIQLRNAARNLGEWESFSDEIQRLEKLSRGMYRGGDLMQIAQQANRMGMELDTFGRFAEHAMVVATAKGEDFGRTMELITSATERGVVRGEAFLRTFGFDLEQTLAQSGITMTQFKNEMDSTRRQQLLYDLVIAESAKNMATFEEITQSGAGNLQAFRGAVGDLAEIMGETTLSPLTKVLRGFTSLLDMFRDDPVGKQILKFASWTATIGGLSLGILGLGKALSFAWLSLSPLILPFAKFGAIAAGIILIAQDLAFAFGGLGESVTEKAFNAIMEFLGVETTFEQFRQSMLGKIASIKGGFESLFKGDWDGVFSAVVELTGESSAAAFGARLVSSLAVGMGIGAFNPVAGALAFTVMMNIDWQWVGGAINSFIDSLVTRFSSTTQEDIDEARQILNLRQMYDEQNPFRLGHRRLPFEDWELLHGKGLLDEYYVWDAAQRASIANRVRGGIFSPSAEAFLKSLNAEPKEPFIYHGTGGGGGTPAHAFSSGTTWTGSGPLNEVAGVVHKQEAVIPWSHLRFGLPGILDFFGFPGFAEGTNGGLTIENSVHRDRLADAIERLVDFLESFRPTIEGAINSPIGRTSMRFADIVDKYNKGEMTPSEAIGAVSLAEFSVPFFGHVISALFPKFTLAKWGIRGLGYLYFLAPTEWIDEFSGGLQPATEALASFIDQDMAGMTAFDLGYAFGETLLVLRKHIRQMIDAVLFGFYDIVKSLIFDIIIPTEKFIIDMVHNLHVTVASFFKGMLAAIWDNTVGAMWNNITSAFSGPAEKIEPEKSGNWFTNLFKNATPTHHPDRPTPIIPISSDFSPNISITVNSSGGDGAKVAQQVKEAIAEAFPQLMDQYYNVLSYKLPNTVEA